MTRPRASFRLLAGMMFLAAPALAAPPAAPETRGPARAMRISEVSLRNRDGKPVHAGERVEVEGVATVATDVLLRPPMQKVFIQDRDAGIALFSRNRTPRLREGDVVRAIGSVLLFNGAMELVLEGVQITGHRSSPPPIPVQPEDLLGNRYSGRLVQVEAVAIGAPVARRDLDIPVVAGNALLNIHLTERQARTFPKLPIQRGTTLRLCGIASQYDRDPPWDSGWQILPRSPSDLSVVRQPPRFTSRDLIAPAAGISFLILGVIAWSLTLRHQVKRKTLAIERAAESLAASEGRYRMLFEHNVAGFFRATMDGRLLECNRAAARLLGYEREEMLNQRVSDFYADPEDLRAVTQLLEERRTVSDIELHLRRKDGSMIWVMVAANRLALHGDEEIIDGTLIDVSERKRATEQMEFLAYHDALTGLPNRALFHDRLSVQLMRATRDAYPVAVLFLDVDRFKRINDTLGHNVGDSLLREIAVRLRDCLRAEDSVARFGGDEFAMLARIRAVDGAEIVGRKILDALAKPFELAGQRLHITASVGVAIHPSDGNEPEVLIRHADLAMYRAKEAGRGNMQFSSSTLDASSAIDRLTLENDLRLAVETQALTVWYQPQIRVSDGTIEGAEALLRWPDSRRGLVPPSVFIPMAEEVGLIGLIGERVLREACSQLSRWKTRFPDLTMSVNVSALQLQDRYFVRQVSSILTDTGVSPQHVELEITESVALGAQMHMGSVIADLERMGLRIGIDDFGTGHSSLNNVRRLPVRSIKIDTSFVRDILTDPNDAAIVSGIISMAHLLGCRTVAEGVETHAQLDHLRAEGCDSFQGYLVSPAIPAEDFETLLASRTALPVNAGAIQG